MITPNPYQLVPCEQKQDAPTGDAGGLFLPQTQLDDGKSPYAQNYREEVANQN